METIDRMAIIVFPREPIVDWVNEIRPDQPIWLEDLSWRGNVYLIPQFETMEEAEAYVEEVFDGFFRNELAEWVEDDSLWPRERTYDLFLEWFDVVYDVVVYDTQPVQIRKTPLDEEGIAE